MFVRKYDLHVLSPGYCMAGQSRRQRRLGGNGLQSPCNALTLLNPRQPLFFRQLSYRKDPHVDEFLLHDALKNAQFRHYYAGRLNEMDARDQQDIIEMLLLLNGAEEAFYVASYIGAAYCRYHSGQTELAFVIGSTETPNQYRIVTILGATNELHLRFSFSPHVERKVRVADFHLDYNWQRERARICVREYWNIRDTPETIPRTTRGYSPQICDCRDIHLTRFRTIKNAPHSKMFSIPVCEYADEAFRSFNPT